MTWLKNMEMLKLKVNKALENSINIIFCFGEELKDRKSENHFSVISNQISESLFHLKESDWKNIVLSIRTSLGYWYWRNC